MLCRARVTVFRRLMALQQHSPRTLSELVGCSHVTVWAISTGRKACRPDLARRIAAALDVETDDLFFVQAG